MMRRLPTVLLLVALLSAGSVSAQGTLELSFKHVSGKSGEKAAVPIFLKSDQNIQTPFTFSINFPSTHLTFLELEAGLLSQKAGWSFETEVRELSGGGENDSQLEFSIDPGEAKFFPSGVVAYIHFQVDEAAPTGDIEMESAVELASASLEAKALPAKITLNAEPIFGCFFYMH